MIVNVVFACIDDRFYVLAEACIYKDQKVTEDGALVNTTGQRRCIRGTLADNFKKFCLTSM